MQWHMLDILLVILDLSQDHSAAPYSLIVLVTEVQVQAWCLCVHVCVCSSVN